MARLVSPYRVANADRQGSSGARRFDRVLIRVTTSTSGADGCSRGGRTGFTFDQAIADFAEKYADQNERDYTALQAAVKDNRAQATTDI